MSEAEKTCPGCGQRVGLYLIALSNAWQDGRGRWWHPECADKVLDAVGGGKPMSEPRWLRVGPPSTAPVPDDATLPRTCAEEITPEEMSDAEVEAALAAAEAERSRYSHRDLAYGGVHYRVMCLISEKARRQGRGTWSPEG